MNIEIKRVLVKDAKLLSEISCKTFYNTFTGTCTEEDMQYFLKTYFNEEKIKTELQDDNDYYYFAYADGALAAYLRFKEDNTSLNKVNEWKAIELKRIYVDEAFKGKGIAQALMDFILSFANENKYEVIFLGVWEHNLRAQKFYEKYGFKNSGYTHDFPIGSTPQTDWWFWKFI